MAKKKKIVAYKSSQIIHLADSKVKHWDELTPNQLKMTVLSASKVKVDDTQETLYTMTFSEFAHLCNFDADSIGGNNYAQVYEIAKKLSSLGVHFETVEGDIVIFYWLDRVTIKPKSGTITYQLDPRLLPFYKTRSGSFAIINLHDYMPLRGRYSLLLYEFLAKWQNNGVVYQTVEDLRAQLRVPEEKYTRPSDFIRLLVYKAVEEINEKTQYSFKVRIEEKIGVRKTVVGVTFYIDLIKGVLLPANKKLVDMLVAEEVGTVIAASIVEAYSRERILGNIAKAKEMAAAGKIKKSLAATICAAVKDDYAGVEAGQGTLFNFTPDSDVIKEKCSECNGIGLVTDFVANRTVPCPKCSPAKPPSAEKEDPDAPWKLEGAGAAIAKALAEAMK